jgi:site-specific DNA-methyltransferase (adenine-specific)
VWFIPYDTVQSKAEKFDHPAGFPVELPARCIKLHGLRPDLMVLDPFLGTGTTLVAAQALGCRSIGIEIDRKYVEIAMQRLKEAKGGQPA